MGYYDGMGLTSTAASTYEAARVTGTPAVLVVGARGASLSLLGVIRGFLDFCPEDQIRGVILNQCSPMTYAALAEEIRRRFGGRVRPLGYLPPMPDCALESRHLGLVTAGEVADLKDKLARLAAQAERTIDLNGLIADWPMAGVLPGGCRDNHKLTRFGYVTLTAKEDNLLCRAGESIRGHEFHHWDASDPGGGFTAEKSSGRAWACVHASDTLYAGYPHFHFYAAPAFAENFYHACIKEKHRHV